MSLLLDQSDWDDYKAIMDEAHNTFHQKSITWRRTITELDRWKEDNLGARKIDTPLKVLLNYNYMRTWPITMPTESGELDKQSVQILINKAYLQESGFLNAFGLFDYSPDYDRFIIDGLVYKPYGDTPTSQMNTEDLIFSIVAKREEILT